jgi:hypothetical protein
MTLTADELDQFLAQHLNSVAAVTAPADPEPMLPAILATVARMMGEAEDEKQLERVFLAAARDEVLWPLVHAAQEGDREAFESLWKKVRPAVLGAIRVTRPALKPEDVAEVENNTSFAVWRALPSCSREKGLFLAWVRKFAQNQARWYRGLKPLGEPLEGEDGSRQIEGERGDERTLPPSACFEELLDLVFEEDAHRAMAALYTRFLDWKPERVCAELAHVPLAALLPALEQDILARYPVLASRLPQVLAPLAARMAEITPDGRRVGETTMADYVDGGACSERVRRWTRDSARTVANKVIQQAKDFLEVASRLRAAAPQKLAFFWCRLLRRSPERFARRAGFFLAQLLNEFRSDFEPLTHLDARQIATATGVLEKQIAELRPPRPLAGYAGGNLLTDIVDWREKVQSMMLGPAHDRHLLAFSYLCGCLPGIAEPAKRG